MNDEEISAGTMRSDSQTRRKLAHKSLQTNMKNTKFVQLFSEVIG
jgi:hypothetical protein